MVLLILQFQSSNVYIAKKKIHSDSNLIVTLLESIATLQQLPDLRLILHRKYESAGKN